MRAPRGLEASIGGTAKGRSESAPDNCMLPLHARGRVRACHSRLIFCMMCILTANQRECLTPRRPLPEHTAEQMEDRECVWSVCRSTAHRYRLFFPLLFRLLGCKLARHRPPLGLEPKIIPVTPNTAQESENKQESEDRLTKPHHLIVAHWRRTCAYSKGFLCFFRDSTVQCYAFSFSLPPTSVPGHNLTARPHACR